MKLFHKTENKYYEIISYLLAKNKELSPDEMTRFIEKNIIGERDFEVENILFTNKPGKEAVFSYAGGTFSPAIFNSLPIRNNQIELQAIRMLARNDYAKHFLSKDTINQLEKLSDEIDSLWDIKDIDIKNQYRYGVSDSVQTYEKQLSIIATAISKHKAIMYDNIVPGRYAYIDAQVFPIKIEYSFINDVFRICAYEAKEERFIKMNLSTMKNIRMQDDVLEYLDEEYQKYLLNNTKKIVLDVDPVNHIIERCFRIFSFYDRRAIYDKDAKKYKLEIRYLKFDENEVIRDILSLGSSVVVIEPKRIQKHVYRRIRKARDNYVENK